MLSKLKQATSRDEVRAIYTQQETPLQLNDLIPFFSSLTPPSDPSIYALKSQQTKEWRETYLLDAQVNDRKEALDFLTEYKLLPQSVTMTEVCQLVPLFRGN